MCNNATAKMTKELQRESNIHWASQ